MVIRRADKNLSFFQFQLVLGLHDRHPEVFREKRRQQVRLIETAMLDHDDRQWKIRRHIRQYRFKGVKPAQRRADDDEPDSHQAILRYIRAALSNSSYAS